MIGGGRRPVERDALRRAFGPVATLRREAPFLRKLWHSTRAQWQRFALMLFVIWATYALLLSPEGWLQLWRLRRQAASLRETITQLQEARTSLDRMRADLDAEEVPLLERRAREEFGFARENERIYVLPYDADDQRCVRAGQVHGGERFSDRDRSAAGTCASQTAVQRAGGAAAAGLPAQRPGQRVDIPPGHE